MDSKIDEIKALIPHREPFLFADEITERSENSLSTKWTVPADLDIFRGHYPDSPLLPGVIVCESIFQAGALFLSGKISEPTDGVPVLTRIQNARFKRMVLPSDTIEITVNLSEVLSGVYFLKGKAMLNSKLAVSGEFACTLAKMTTK